MLKAHHRAEIGRLVRIDQTASTSGVLSSLYNWFPSEVVVNRSGTKSIPGVYWDNVHAYIQEILPEIKANAETVLIPTHIEVPAMPGSPVDEEKESFRALIAEARIKAEAQLTRAQSLRNALEEVERQLEQA